MSTSGNQLSERAHAELILLAEDTMENIRDVKNVSRIVLISYTAAFGYIYLYGKSDDILSAAFIIGGLFVMCLCASFFPSKLSERRLRLDKIYRQFEKEFNDVYGSFSELNKDDGGDSFYKIFSILYPFVLIIIYMSKRGF